MVMFPSNERILIVAGYFVGLLGQVASIRARID